MSLDAFIVESKHDRRGPAERPFSGVPAASEAGW
jgi:hypothetical protein